MLDKIRMFKGQTLSTLVQHKKFDVIEVSDSGVDIFVHSTGRGRHISKKEINESWEYLIVNGNITATYILNEIFSRSSAYIATFLSKIEGVTYTTNPLKFIYR